jgi:hypothetical protein
MTDVSCGGRPRTHTRSPGIPSTSTLATNPLVRPSKTSEACHCRRQVSHVIPADHPRGAGAGAPRVAEVDTGTLVQKLIKAILSYNRPIRPAARCAIVPYHPATASMLMRSDNDFACRVVRALAQAPEALVTLLLTTDQRTRPTAAGVSAGRQQWGEHGMRRHHRRCGTAVSPRAGT